jgi:glycosyltransferase involved in cell wall biosynthesis
MNAKDLSILIPARNEMFLARTIEDILSNAEMDTEVIVVLDGQWADPAIKDAGNVNIIYLPNSIGQRAATNLACRLSKAKYVMKVDAHCAFDKGFDRKLMETMQDDWTVVPTMRNLHGFDWVCPDGHRRYQGRSGICLEPGCGKETVRDMVWEPRRGTRNYSYCFDTEPHFQYFRDYSKRPEGRGDLTETMSLQGSCFMMTREKYWELNICDEAFGSWGSQGIEVAVKTWLSGGKVMCNHTTWYAHLFRTQGGDFGFPYPQSQKQIAGAKKKARDMFFGRKWEGMKYPLSWLVERFMPVDVVVGGKNIGWTQQDVENLKKVEAGEVELE